MVTRFFLGLALVATSIPAWSQVEPSASGGGGPQDDSLMNMPTAVSGAFYPSAPGDEERSNYLSAGLVVSASYDDNVLTRQTVQPVEAGIYQIRPTVGIETKTTRTKASLFYSPGFSFFDPTSELNAAGQNAQASFDYRFTPRMSVSAQEVFQQNSTIFSAPYAISSAALNGSGDLGASPILLLPYVDQYSTTTGVHLGYQFSRSSMIGGSGYFSRFNFSNPSQYTGLYNSNSSGGSGFYTRRVGRSQNIGVEYKYSDTQFDSVSSTTHSQYASLFYTVRLSNNLSLSLKGGPEYSTTAYLGAPTTSSWSPSGTIGIGWQQKRANFAMDYSRAVTTGFGVLGTYTTDTAGAEFEWLFTKRLIGGANGNYANTQTASSLFSNPGQVGHLMFGRASLQYVLSERVNLTGEYVRLHENYGGIAQIKDDPDEDMLTVSLNFVFMKPLGR